MRAMAQVHPEAADFAANDEIPGSGRAVRAVGGEAPTARFADPTPLGLVGLAIGCAALVPIAFGAKVGVSGLITAAVICVLFGGGCQLIAGLLNLANGNLLGGTLFAAFAFNWALNGWALWSLAHGVVPEHQILLATETASLVLFVPLTYAFGHYSGLLFAFLLDIDVLYGFKLLAGYGHVGGTEIPIALCTVALGVIALWIAVAMLVNPVAGRRVLPMPGPLFRGRAPAH